MDRNDNEHSHVVVLSPHLDDAVFSAWSILTSNADVDVVTVFAGVPAAGFVSSLDKRGGATDSADRVQQRRRDDAAALDMAGRSPIHLDLLDSQYRLESVPKLRDEVARDPGRFVTIVSGSPELTVQPEVIDASAGSYLTLDSIVYAPTGIGKHPDHRDVARFGQYLLSRGFQVSFYADVPYNIRFGLPTWLGADSNDVADEWIDNTLYELLGDVHDLHRDVVRLSPDDIARKLEALHLYTTEFEPANRDFGGALDDYEMMQWEVYWTPRN